MKNVYLVFEKYTLSHGGSVCSVVSSIEEAKKEIILLKKRAEELGDWNVDYFYEEHPVGSRFTASLETN